MLRGTVCRLLAVALISQLTTLRDGVCGEESTTKPATACHRARRREGCEGPSGRNRADDTVWIPISRPSIQIPGIELQQALGGFPTIRKAAVSSREAALRVLCVGSR